MDDDLNQLTRDELVTEVRKLRLGIRKHRDSTGHDLCWHHPELWGLLPEKIDPSVAVPPWPQFLRGCLQYRESLDAQLPNAPRVAEEFTGRHRESQDETDLYEIERSLWTNDPRIYHDSLHHDALLVFQETGLITRDTAVAAIGEENRENRHWAEVSFSDQRVLSPTPDTRVLIYKAIARWNYEQDPITVLCSSIYALNSGEWKLVFHQQTLTAA